MNTKLRERIYDIVVCLAMAAAAAGLVMFPQESVGAAKSGVQICADVIVPSLFPFFVLSSMAVRLGLADKLGRLLEPVMRPLFNVGGAASTAFVLGFIGGYPVGAKTVISLYENGSCTKSEAERLLSFCNNSGPAFILGVVGAGIFSSSLVGLLLYLSHTAASVCIGVLFRKWGGKSANVRAKPQAAKSEKFPAAFTGSVASAFRSSLNICGFVIFFTVFIKLLFTAGVMPFLSDVIGAVFSPLGFDDIWAERLLTGIIEISSGVWSLKGAAGELQSSMALAAFMLGWAGLSVHCQVLSFISGSGLSAKTYIIGKFLHGILAAVFTYFLAGIFTPDTAVASYLAEQVTGIASMGFKTSLLVSLISAAALAVIFGIVCIFSKRCGKKHGRHV